MASRGILINRTTVKNEKTNSIKEAFDMVKTMAKEASPQNRLKLEIVLDQYRYLVYEPLVLSTDEVPELAYVDLTVTSLADGVRSIISGCDWINGARFTPVEGKPYYKYQFSKDESGNYPRFREFLVDREHIPMAKSEEMIYPFDHFSDAERQDAKNLKGLYLPYETAKKLKDAPISGTECHFFVEWEWYACHVKGVNLKNTKELDGQKYAFVELYKEDADAFHNKSNKNLRLNGRRTYFCNSPAFLTPGTFSYDYKNGTLYYYPKDGGRPRGALEFPRVENLLVFKGLANLTVDKLIFTGTTSTYLCDHPYLSGQANNLRGWEMLTDAAVLMTDINRVTVQNCVFEQLGGNGLQMTDRNIGVRVRDCIFKNINMSAMRIGNPTWNWQDEKNRTYDVRVENNYMEHIAYGYPTAPAFYITQVDGFEFLHNTIRDVAYSAVSLGWNWDVVYYALGSRVNVRDAHLAYNRFENHMMLLQDGGAIYALGANCHHDYEKRFNSMHDNYSSSEGMRDRGRYGYYMDGSASNWDCYHNVMINANYPLFSQPHPRATSWHNHIYDNYINTPLAPEGILAPERDVIYTDNHIDLLSEAELLAKYEEAKRIKEASGCSAELLRSVAVLYQK